MISHIWVSIIRLGLISFVFQDRRAKTPVLIVPYEIVNPRITLNLKRSFNKAFWIDCSLYKALQRFSFGIKKKLANYRIPNNSRHPEEHWNTEKNAVFQDPYFLIRHTLGITKIPTWKYFMCIQARNFDFSDLCTETCSQNRLKIGFFRTKMLVVLLCMT